jgi:hypothetical protein
MNVSLACGALDLKTFTNCVERKDGTFTDNASNSTGNEVRDARRDVMGFHNMSARSFVCSEENPHVRSDLKERCYNSSIVPLYPLFSINLFQRVLE